MLTSINGKDFCLNCDLIYRVEEAPDTIITLVNGKTLRVKNSVEDIKKKVVEYKREIFCCIQEEG